MKHTSVLLYFFLYPVILFSQDIGVNKVYQITWTHSSEPASWTPNVGFGETKYEVFAIFYSDGSGKVFSLESTKSAATKTLDSFDKNIIWVKPDKASDIVSFAWSATGNKIRITKSTTWKMPAGEHPFEVYDRNRKSELDTQYKINTSINNLHGSLVIFGIGVFEPLTTTDSKVLIEKYNL